jgi:hypothetical protein
MNHKNQFILWILALSGLTVSAIFPTVAYARRNDREGLNFGSSFRVLDSDDRGEQSVVSDKNTRTKSSGQAFSPYLGYGFGAINLGLMLNIENKYEEFSEGNPESNQRLSRNASTAGKSVSLFSRFNFGKVMFFEAGMGLYSQTKDVHTETRSVTGDSFAGTTSDHKSSGMGPGYHLGGGLEIPVDNGFYFSASYIIHSYQLHDTTRSSYGAVIGSQQKRELSFGISYYN